jgi:hypothetical protein
VASSLNNNQTDTSEASTLNSTPAPHPTFEHLRSEKIESLNVVVEEYRHTVTGTLHYHIASDNPENVFLVALRTIPVDSTGVAHILEHTVLCGSERYPVRDPFFMMIRRSLNTFMNAFTSSDWTAYPFASQNRKDFKNLLDVYLDAVFFSRLDKLDFAQEGHRLEFAEADNSDSELLFKGIVFNEMKGAMSSPVSTLWQTLSSHLFPTTTYHHNSGGEPVHIPDLSYDDLQAFYKKHYHPSNAIFMTFGDIPAAEHQQIFEHRALSRFSAQDDIIDVHDEQRLLQPVTVEARYAIDASETGNDKTHIVLGWLLGRSIDMEAMLKAHLLSGILLDNSASPLRQALETSSLGTAPSPLCGIEDSNREMSFMCGIEGSRPEHTEAIEQLVIDVLNDVARNGVPQDRIEAVLHQLELSQREISGDGYPYGMHLILSGLSAAIHRGDVISALNLDPVLEKLHEEIHDPNFIKQLVQTQLLDNPHRVRLTMKPDTTLAEAQKTAESQRLATIKQALTEAERQEIIRQSQALNERQMQQDDPGILPKVDLDDIPPTAAVINGHDSRIHDFPARFYAQGTNGLCYQQIITRLPALNDELLPLLTLYTRCITELGCGNRDYLATQAWMDSVSGGVHAYSSVRGTIDDIQNISGYFTLSGKALVRNHVDFSELMQDMLKQVRFDELPRIREIIAQERARREQGITGQGHSLALAAACSGMSPTAALHHRLRGLSGIQALKQLDDKMTNSDSLQALAHQFSDIHTVINNAPHQFLVIGEQEHQQQLLHDLEARWQGQPQANPADTLSLTAIRQNTQQMWITSTQVNFCARAYPTVAPDHPDAAALDVLAGFMRNGYLHRAIREIGGAYGGGASHDSDNAAFRFYSYRDPRLQETLDDFDRALEWLQSNAHEWRQVEEAILGIFGSLDKPGSPAGEAKEAYYNELYGRNEAHRQHYRERVLKVTVADLQRVGATYLTPDNASTAIITSSAGLELHGDLGLQVYTL